MYSHAEYMRKWRLKPENIKNHAIYMKEWRKLNAVNIKEHRTIQRKKALSLIGDKCIFCGSTEHLIFHEIHGLTHKYSIRYYLEHSQDFITVCFHHHRTIHDISEYPEILNYRLH